MNTILKSLVIVSSLSLLAAPFSISAAEGTHGATKKMGCKEEAKTQKFESKAERTKFMKDCKAKHKAAK